MLMVAGEWETGLPRQPRRTLFAIGTGRTQCRRRVPSASRTGDDARTVDSSVRTFANRSSFVVARVIRVFNRSVSFLAN